MQIALVCSFVRAEERWIYEAFRRAGVTVDMVNDRSIVVDLDRLDGWRKYDAVVLRSLGYWRALHLARCFEALGLPVINPFSVVLTCGNKLLTTLTLIRAGIPVPHTRIAFSVDAALRGMDDMGYPVVLKPVVGSWGRLIARLNDRDAAEAVLEHRDTLGAFVHHIYYLQEHIPKPNRDIRVIVVGGQVVASIYRHSDHWITNTARGGRATRCPLTPELHDLCLRTAMAIGGGILAIDVFEDPERGLLVNEVNHSMEFRNAMEASGVDIPAYIVDFVQQVVRYGWEEAHMAPVSESRL